MAVEQPGISPFTPTPPHSQITVALCSSRGNQRRSETEGLCAIDFALIELASRVRRNVSRCEAWARSIAVLARQCLGEQTGCF
jgi:hypothetical protein